MNSRSENIKISIESMKANIARAQKILDARIQASMHLSVTNITAAFVEQTDSLLQLEASMYVAIVDLCKPVLATFYSKENTLLSHSLISQCLNILMKSCSLFAVVSTFLQTHCTKSKDEFDKKTINAFTQASAVYGESIARLLSLYAEAKYRYFHDNPENDAEILTIVILLIGIKFNINNKVLSNTLFPESDLKMALDYFISHTRDSHCLLQGIAFFTPRAKFWQSDSANAIKPRFSASELISFYEKSEPEKIESPSLRQANKELFQLTVCLLRSDEYIQRYTKVKAKSRTSEPRWKKSAVSSINSEDIHTVLKKLLAEYQPVAIKPNNSSAALCLSTHSFTFLGNFCYGDSYKAFGSARLLLSIQKELLTDLLDFFEYYFLLSDWLGSLRQLVVASEAGSNLLQQMLRNNQITKIASDSWLEHIKLLETYQELSSDLLENRGINDKFLELSNKISFKSPEEESTIRNITLSELPLLLGVGKSAHQIACRFVEKRRLACLSFFRSLDNDAKRRDQLKNKMVAVQSLEQPPAEMQDKIIDTEASTIKTNLNEKKSTLLENALLALGQRKLDIALALFKNMPKDADHFSLIKSHWGQAECWEAKAQESSHKNERSRFMQACQQAYRTTLQYIQARLSHTDKCTTEYENLLVDESFIKFKLVNIASKQEEKREWRAMKAGIYTETLEPDFTLKSNQDHTETPPSKPDIHVNPWHFSLMESDALARIFRLLSHQGIDFYIYGGAVRDSLLNCKPRDYDICVSESLDKLDLILSTHQYKTRKIGIEHPIIEVKLEDDITLEISPRIGKKILDHDSINTEIESMADFESSDATINAFRYYPLSKKLLYLAESMADLENKHLGLFRNQSISERFRSDPALYFRSVSLAARLQHLGFTLDAAITKELSHYKIAYPYLETKAKHKCFVMFARAFLNGNAANTWELIQQYRVFSPLDTASNAMISQLCTTLDNNTGENPMHYLSLLVTAFLWQPLNEKLFLPDQTPLSSTSLHQVINDLLTNTEIGIPNTRICERVRNILLLTVMRRYREHFAFVPDNIIYPDFVGCEDLINLINSAEGNGVSNDQIRIKRQHYF